jgi:formylmethanofuran dehydrogenase subunit C
MSITLTYRGETSLPVEVEGLTPDWAWDKPLIAIERFEIFHGNQKLPLAEMFTVAGDAGDKQFDFDGNLAGVHWIGAHMRSGQIYIHGCAGRHLGSELRGGEIHVEGDAGDWIGCEMRGGSIRVHGNAGHLVGAAYRGSAQGMRGGTIVADGNAGNEIGVLMKEGVIAIGGQAGDLIGFNMMGGAVVVLGNAGIRPGAGMHGGTIAIFGPTQPPILSSFRHDRIAKPETLARILQKLSSDAAQPFEAALSTEMAVYIGDQVADGTGEIYLPHLVGGDD